MADTGHNDGEVGRIANYYPKLFGMVDLSHFTATSLFPSCGRWTERPKWTHSFTECGPTIKIKKKYTLGCPTALDHDVYRLHSVGLHWPSTLYQPSHEAVGELKFPTGYNQLGFGLC